MQDEGSGTYVNRTRSRQRGSRVGRVVALVVAAAMLTAGCSTISQAGAAAVVGDSSISISRLQDLTTEMTKAGISTDPATQQPFAVGAAQRAVLEKLIASRLIAAAARAEKVSVTAGQVDALLGQVQVPAGEDVTSYVAKGSGIPPSYVRQYARDALLTDKLAAALVPGDPATTGDHRRAALGEAFQQTARRIGVEVNPRYGAWNVDSVSIDPLVSGGLSHPAGAATPTPAPAASSAQ